MDAREIAEISGQLPICMSAKDHEVFARFCALKSVIILIACEDGDANRGAWPTHHEAQDHAIFASAWALKSLLSARACKDIEFTNGPWSVPHMSAYAQKVAASSCYPNSDHGAIAAGAIASIRGQSSYTSTANAQAKAPNVREENAVMSFIAEAAIDCKSGICYSKLSDKAHAIAESSG
eukprot:gnl/MRDRNA2_/MRDRNA2_86287_c0_seq6.p1 gnl/MRDRNA2_/MRDRNA2_86287_c0~~gnl/MRDRNA2_/MRDRNA2_86287_c0_seq6.p1  ORF type:complete len:179 (-),score=2.33 gnl/MRDRNA2_/MRDRNA2_86287_c0_seq6:286-822(-)